MANELTGGGKIVAGTGIGMIFGAMYGASSAAWTQDPSKWKAINMSAAMKIVGKNAGIFGFIALAFTSTETLVESIRGKKSPLNAAAGGFAAGVVTGMVKKNFNLCFAAGATLGVAAGVVELLKVRDIDENSLKKRSPYIV